MDFHNKNIINMMGLRRGSIKLQKYYTNKCQTIIEKVIEPFDFQLESRNIKVVFEKGDCFQQNKIETDWGLY
jgi:hypothetical protein